jgi:hypothetical protein
MSRPRLKTYGPINGDCGLEYRSLNMNGEFVVTNSDVAKLAAWPNIDDLASMD